MDDWERTVNARSIKAAAAVTYKQHCKDIFYHMFSWYNLGLKDFKDAVVEILFFILNLILIICFPIVIPLAAYGRKLYAAKQLRIEKHNFEKRVNRLANRVQKL